MDMFYCLTYSHGHVPSPQKNEEKKKKKQEEEKSHVNRQ